ncbi:MAG: (Fe-S)-binding protein [Phycisphaerales bacterium]|nr:MAG: (Fe-S)-binding protein [Phycisphaerales bacterium]
MNWIAMSLMLVVLLALFAWSAARRWKLLMIGRPAARFDDIGQRVAGMLRFGFGQQRMPRYKLAGIGHILIFSGFLVLLFRSLVLFGRGFNVGFDLFVLEHGTALGDIYSFLKDLVIILVIIGVVIFLYYRLITRARRMTLSGEALLILGIIGVMMVADVIYDGSWFVLEDRAGHLELAFTWASPVGSAAALGMQNISEGGLRFLLHLGFWTHTSLVLIFLNILPYSKHFHVITALPNVFFRELKPRGRLPNMEDIEGMLEREETLGVARIQNLSWKSILDLYTCTECGRCTDQCPANRTGKLLSPKHLTIDLRDYLYHHEKQLVRRNGSNVAGAGEGSASTEDASGSGELLVPTTIKPEVLWACTTCRACETECPVFITYVDKIVDFRRNLVMEVGEFPSELQNAFQGLERDGNPWSFQAADRGAWAEGLDIPVMAELGEEKPEYLMWVGCAPSFDERAKKVSRATAQLLKAAGVSFAILGMEETCNGDPARRAGNEFLFQTMAQANIETLNNYGVKKIITTCPHCYNTLRNEYPDFGGHYQVIHHTEMLADLVRQGRLQPKRRVAGRVVFHDSCYLGRYNDVYDPPREILRRIPGAQLVEAAESRDRGMCCGAGGAQMFKEEEEGDGRVNHARIDQLLRTQPEVVSSSCPFCQVMLTDGLTDKEREDVRQLDVAELLWQSVAEEEQLSEAKAGTESAAVE